MKTKDLTTMAILTALALALSWLERLIPLELIIPLPGVKLGLANTVTLFALYQLSVPAAVLILISRCLLTALFSGNMTGLAFSLAGGFLAMGVMAMARRSCSASQTASAPISSQRIRQRWQTAFLSRAPARTI